MWLEEYLSEIGCTRTSSLEDLIDGQMRRFFYCSVNLWHSGRGPAAERVVTRCDAPEAILADLKRDGFGFCFQLIELHAAALKALGHVVTRHPALPLNCPHEEVDEVELADRIANELFPHEVMRLADGGLVDVGYSANALQGVLRCGAGEEAQCGDSRYRVLAVAAGWQQLEVWLKGGWTALYRFREQAAEEVQPCVERMFRTPRRVRIRDDYLYVARVGPGLRRWLYVTIASRTAVWKRVVDGATAEERAVESWEEAKQLVAAEFGWALDERLRELFRR